MSPLKYIVFIICISLLFFACEANEPAVSRAELIQEKLDERIALLHKNKRKRCLDETFAEAENIVDSMVRAQARREKDAISKPPKPTKPERPDVFILQDTGTIHPLVLDSMNRDK